MAVCDWCGSEMTTAESCNVKALHRGGVPTAMIRWGRERGWKASSRCGDCGVLPGRYHHLGCDVQQCPVCRGQMITCGCRFDEDGPDDGDGAELLDLYLDSNGDPTERVRNHGGEVIIHYTDEIPESDITTVRGIPCTTALRTVIDVAPDVDAAHLDRIVQDCLDRRLFTVSEARVRLSQPDMERRPGAELLRRALPE